MVPMSFYLTIKNDKNKTKQNNYDKNKTILLKNKRKNVRLFRNSQKEFLVSSILSSCLDRKTIDQKEIHKRKEKLSNRRGSRLNIIHDDDSYTFNIQTIRT